MTAAHALRCVPARLGTSLGRFRSSDTGVAAVEFALIMPFMVAVFFGLVEITQAVMADRKLTVLSRALADLPAQRTQMSTSEMDNVFDAATLTMRPFDASTIQMVVTSVLVTRVNATTYLGTVDWSCGRNLATAAVRAADPTNNLSVRATGSSYTVPDGFQSTNTQSFIQVETLLPYLPTFGHYITSTLRFRENASWPVRSGTKVTGPGTCPAG